MTENFRHRSPKNRHYVASVMVSDIVMDWASWINSRDGLPKNVIDEQNWWRF